MMWRSLKSSRLYAGGAAFAKVVLAVEDVELALASLLPLNFRWALQGDSLAYGSRHGLGVGRGIFRRWVS